MRELRPISALAALVLLASSLGGAISPDSPAIPLFFAADSNHDGLVLRTPEMTIHFRPGEVAYTLSSTEARTLQITYPGGRPVHAQGVDELTGKVNYFLGTDQSAWKPNVPIYSGILYPEMWTGVDVAYAIVGGSLKTEFRIAPGIAVSTIQWHIDGADSVAVQPDGSLVVTAGNHFLREAAPQVFEQDRITGQMNPIEGAFRILPGHSVGIRVGTYDHRNRLIFDPVIGYSTFLGGSGQSHATAVAIDSNGNSIIAGYTTSLDLAPGATTFGAPLRTTAFVAKFTAAGSRLIFCTYLGGSLDNRAFAVAVDRWNNIYVAGVTSSSNFPLMKPLQASRNGAQDAFIAELNPTGNALVFSTYWGGSGAEQAYGLAVSRQGHIYVTGDTQSTNFPTVRAIQPFNGGGQDAFIAKLGISGSAVMWSSYLGGSADEHAAAIAVDIAGGATLTGSVCELPNCRCFSTSARGHSERVYFEVERSREWAGVQYVCRRKRSQPGAPRGRKRCGDGLD